MPNTAVGKSTQNSPTGSQPISPGAPSRIASIDVFRGLTILVMIFVNDVSEVKGLPWWTYHLPGNVNGMTYVDMVFPFFLFIVGISLPLAIRHRLSKGDTPIQLWTHIIVRSFALVVLGMALANAEKVNQTLTHMSGNVWLLLTLVGAILFWNVYPRTEKYKLLFKGMKFAGLLLMVAMFLIFRRTAHDGHIAWLDFGYWEILGLIGWTYFAVCILYIPTRRWRWAPLTWLVALTALNAITLAHWVSFPEALPFYYWPWNSGCFALLTMSGVVVSSIFLTHDFATTFKQKTTLALGFAAILLITGRLLTPLGISKIRATPTWGLYSAGAATLCFLALYWIADVHKHTKWAAIVKPAGSNTLLTYLLPDLWFVTLGSVAILNQWESGWQGVIKSIVFTFVILALSSLLTKAKLRLQL
jgi:heparan-alpha-glucosaminide N-acetyltransferase